ncbi:hypothetical protein RG47T_0637 [Mucilaginibacter polytrichastri]|uniref:Uncharacterized protein n=1 Tax=Mucilaginibacter polytrichastri TaxID=1302689 RepID=A0A1Q5ZTZ0_9SPHI|nr:hypothetical protein RG47T_0637 [Mucilaginibacter polytrichastri]
MSYWYKFISLCRAINLQEIFRISTFFCQIIMQITLTCTYVKPM